jgi:hypothetical protein
MKAQRQIKIDPGIKIKIKIGISKQKTAYPVNRTYLFIHSTFSEI